LLKIKGFSYEKPWFLRLQLKRFRTETPWSKNLTKSQAQNLSTGIGFGFWSLRPAARKNPPAQPSGAIPGALSSRLLGGSFGFKTCSRSGSLAGQFVC